jgi:hypothetical protein
MMELGGNHDMAEAVLAKAEAFGTLNNYHFSNSNLNEK